MQKEISHGHVKNGERPLEFEKFSQECVEHRMSDWLLSAWSLMSTESPGLEINSLRGHHHMDNVCKLEGGNHWTLKTSLKTAVSLTNCFQLHPLE